MEKATGSAAASGPRDNINQKLGDVLRYGPRKDGGVSAGEGDEKKKGSGSGEAGAAGSDGRDDAGGKGAGADDEARAGSGADGHGEHGSDGAGEGAGDAGEGAGDAGAGAGDDDAPGLTLKDLAAALEVDPADVYKVAVSLGERDGKPVYATLGELKDSYRTAQEFEAMRAEEAESRREWEHQRNADLRDIAAIVDVLPAVPPQLTAAIEQRNKAMLERERRLMLAAIPEWRDPTRLTAERDGMAKLAAKYGFSKEEFEGLTDHRLARFVRDAWLTAERESAAAKKLREMRGGSGNNKPSGRQGQPGAGAHIQQLRERARKSGDRSDKIAAVRELLKGK